MFWNILLLVMGTFSTLYYLLCGLTSGLGTSALWIWLLAGIPCILAGCGGLYCWKKSVDLPVGVWVLQTGKILLTTLMVLFLLVEGMIAGHMNDKGESELDYIVVLGAQVRGEEPSPALAGRIEKAVEYMKENPQTIAIVSGGQGAGEDISEAECMARGLRAAGISADRILLEDRSTSTSENLRYSFEILRESMGERQEPETVGVVTSNFHVFRAIKLAEKQAADLMSDREENGDAVRDESEGGIRIHGIAAEFTGIRLPHYMAREFCSIIVDLLKGNLL